MSKTVLASVLSLLAATCSFFPAYASALPSASVVAYLSYSTTSVTTSAYVTVVASTSAAFSDLFVCDTSGHFTKLAIGAAGSEIDIQGDPVSSCSFVETGKIIPLGSRISVKALDATASTGGLMVSGSK